MTGIPEDTADLEEGGSGIVLFTPSSYGSLGFTLKKGTGASLTDLVAGTANTSLGVPMSRRCPGKPGFGCAPTMDKAAAAAVESNVAALSCFLPGSTAVCGANATNVPHSGFTPIYVPGVAAVMTTITGDLITGSVRTYLQNSRQNTGEPADTNNRDTMYDLLGGDLTTPGVIRIPVCSADVAYKAWEHGMPIDTPHYPCSPMPKTTSDCGDSTFVDQTSSASPSVSDCMELVDDIEGSDNSYKIFSDQQAILTKRSCVFGVQGKSGGTYIANQDVVDLIRDSIAKFGGSGKIGAKGTMVCGGDSVEWGIY
ncbi:hypothetical protein SEUCBS140593_008587 [Sporothrix eucalyptigena]|uniref:Ecp2 effector protein-like domain-containing protein n=1 Tax=Sporothrix eucalyptigena TaxID=1812306 RepID=A0ABP0CQL0_9PEZI